MKLIDNAKQVLLRAWSVRLAAATTLFSLLELMNEVLPFISPLVPDKMFTALAALCGAGAVVVRFIKQNMEARDATDSPL